MCNRLFFPRWHNLAFLRFRAACRRCEIALFSFRYLTLTLGFSCFRRCRHWRLQAVTLYFNPLTIFSLSLPTSVSTSYYNHVFIYQAAIFFHHQPKKQFWTWSKFKSNTNLIFFSLKLFKQEAHFIITNVFVYVDFNEFKNFRYLFSCQVFRIFIDIFKELEKNVGHKKQFIESADPSCK